MINVKASKNALTVDGTELMTSGSVNVNFVDFSFSDDWTGLMKTAIFQTKKVSIPIQLSDDKLTIAVPWEVLAVAGETIQVGVYGTNMERTDDIVLPTVWGSIGRVSQGVVVSNPPSPYPTPDTYLQLIKLIESLLGSGGMGTYRHDELQNRELPGQHPISAIANLSNVLDAFRESDGLLAEDVERALTTMDVLSADLTSLSDKLLELENKVPEVDLTGVYKFKGSVKTINDLPTTGMEIGDVWNVIDDGGMNYAWDGEYWDALGGTFEMEPEEPIPGDEIDAIVKEVMDSEARRGRFAQANFRS